MKLLVALFLTFALANGSVDIDWSQVKPISQFPEYWTIRGLVPPKPIENEYVEASPRIVNGNIANPGQFPYQVAIISRFSQGSGLCGGSILTARTVLTAAHCLRLQELSTSSVIIFGAQNRTNANEPTQFRVEVPNTTYRIHPGWIPTLIRNDVALIVMRDPIAFSTAVQPIALPTALREELFVNVFGTVSGWGVFSDEIGQASDVLRFVSTQIIANDRCSVFFPTVIRDEHICLNGLERRGPCSGDSGGPLTVQRGGRSVQVGIVSFGLGAGCELLWPSVFSRVTSFLPFIEANMV
jgi:secreted trypsin-like serine protease